MLSSMPSPLGHALAGLAVAVAGDRRPVPGFWQFLTRPFAITCILVAALPDADLLLGGFHRTITHSVGATAAVIIVAMAVTAWVTPIRRRTTGRSPWTIALLCASAHATHLLTDWLGTDLFTPAGIQLMWPFSERWFISGWNLFPQIERRHIFSLSSLTIN